MTSTRFGLGALIALVLFAASPTAVSAKVEAVATPAADETLIYVLREGRFMGSGAKVWIALNNETVAYD